MYKLVNLSTKMTESKMSTQIASPRAMSMMHEWTSVNGWSSRPTTTKEGSAGRMEVSGARSQLALRRCQTMMEKQQVYRPHRRQHCDSSTIDFIKHLETLNKETEAKLKNSMHVLAIQRSKTDLDYRDSNSSLLGNLSTGFFRERTHMYLTNVQDLTKYKEPTTQTSKQEMKIGLAVVPRKGLIALQTTDTEAYNQAPGLTYTSSVKGRSLIKRNKMIEHIKQGNKLLEVAEESKVKEEEITKDLGDYTILDLQSKIFEMTDTKSLRRQPINVPNKLDPADKPKRLASGGVDRSVTLPAIKNLTPFKL